MGYIIDISHHQDPRKIDYSALCKQLVMAIIRVQYGSSLIDRHYKTHIAEIKKRRVPFGVYAWVRGINLKDMEVEAQDFYNRSKDLNPLFYVLDVEEKSMNNMRAGINAYINKLRSLTDKKIGIYIAHHHYKNFNLDTSKADFVWIPHYGANNGKANSSPKYPCDLHQYTDKGRLNGYNGNLDLNRLMSGKKLEFFIGKPIVKENNKIESNREDPKVNVTTYKIKNGDTLGSIAKRHNTTVDAIAKINNIKNPNMIYVGDIIKIPGATVNTPDSILYIVKRGDTLGEIADKYKTTVYKLVKDNNITNRNLIYPGQKIKIIK